MVIVEQMRTTDASNMHVERSDRRARMGWGWNGRMMVGVWGNSSIAYLIIVCRTDFYSKTTRTTMISK